MEDKKNIELSCDIVEDLLPVYCDKQATDGSVRAVEEHLKKCEHCQRIYKEMSESVELGSEQENQEREIDPLKKVKRRQRLMVILFFLLGAGVCIGIFYALFLGVVPVKSEDLEIALGAENIEDGYAIFEEEKPEETIAKTVKGYGVYFELKLPEGQYILYRGEDNSDSDTIAMVYKVYSVLNLPFDDRGKYPNEASVGVEANRKFTDEDKVIFRFRDKDVVYSLKQIAEEQGIQ